MADKRVYIAVSGNIGAGKSTLVEFLCKTYGIEPFYEPHEDNPYLVDFYADMERWAFPSQVFFLSHKLRIHRQLDATPGTVVQDRTIYEDAEIFATALWRSGKMSERDWRTYSELYATVSTLLTPPDLMIHLRCPMRTLKRRIELRGRAMEQAIPSAYLKLLDELYEAWIERYRAIGEVLVLDTSKLDYITDLVDRLDVMQRLEALVPGRLAARRAAAGT